MMKYFLKMLVILLAPFSLSAQNLPDDATQYYDFWVGEWDLTWADQDGNEGKGINRIEKTLDGTVIQEHFEAVSGQLAGYKGTSISVYNPNTGWHQAWADNNGGYLSMSGMTDGNKRIFQTGERKTPNGTIISRMVFYDIQEDRFSWDWEYSTDDGENWNLNWRISYQRMQTDQPVQK